MLQEPISILKGVGKATAEALNELGIFTMEDVLFTFPTRHEDFRLKDLTLTDHNERVTVEGRVESDPTILFMGKKSRLQVKVLTGRHLIKAVFFNQPYLKSKFVPGEIVTISGKWDKGRQVIQASAHQLGPRTDAHDFEPVYSLKGRVTQKVFRRILTQVFEQTKDEWVDPLPESVRDSYRLPGLFQALQAIHFPEDADSTKNARRRFVYEELLQFQLKMQALKKLRKEANVGRAVDYDQLLITSFVSSLPYQLTGAQQRAVTEILNDLRAPYQMNRLLQGDVGSGKTVVAAITLIAGYSAGLQGAIMAPTEILAEQHANAFFEWFTPLGIQVALLTGSTKAKARRQILEGLQNGEIDVVIGTHALIQPDVQFHNLGVVVTDEQHRFGVEQRRVLKQKGLEPDVLFMTATPIPRTLAITAFGEMDVTVVDEMPAGRKPIETYWMKEQQLPALLSRLKKELLAGRQAYVICPLIEESDKLDLQNVLDIFHQLQHYYEPAFKVELMHGKLPSDEKDAVMRRFSENESQILVSTTVVEVGVNIPNATFMMIFDAERFGLAQLHQLRGRVGRGDHQSYCVLIADPKTEVGKERMTSMTETTDGFALAEKDLELRGPGDFFGRKQSGMPEFKIADLVHDYRALQTAREDAERLVDSSYFWNSEEWQPYREALEKSGILDGHRID
ncbi:ATP-dependent DNA helicase RecG [Chryseomicrobium sp. FSL W7-1435]|uniref:ATP-dependent DNA helicase RecG n=1 Tax=Chryseomicrobium sp. FSL W7-1435 TaxID=2921704 RepID=UPI00315A1876